MDDQFLERLNTLKKRHKLSYSKLGEILGVSKDTAGNYLLGRTEMSIADAKKIAFALKEDPNWLLGLGANTLIANEPEPRYRTGKDSRHLIPYYDVDVMATPIEVFNDQTITPAFNIELPGFSDCDFAINIYGHSMYPTYESGTIVLCKQITDKSLILYGEAYLIVTQDYRMVKRVLKSDRKGYIVAASDNLNGQSSPDGKTYGSTEINIDKILKLYIVKGKINRTQI